MRARFDNASPIFEQIASMMKADIASGALAPGARVPPVRELAQEYGANPNTVQRALAGLEQEGLMYAERTAGRFVTEDGGRIASLRAELSERVFKRFVTDAAAMGYTCEAALEMVKKHWREEDA